MVRTERQLQAAYEKGKISLREFHEALSKIGTARYARPHQRPEKPLFLTIKSDLSLNLGDKSVSHDGLAAALDTATQKGDKDQRIYSPWRQDGRLWAGDGFDKDLLRDAGYLKIALVGLDAGQSSDNPDATNQNAAQPRPRRGGKASP